MGTKIRATRQDKTRLTKYTTSLTKCLKDPINDLQTICSEGSFEGRSAATVLSSGRLMTISEVVMRVIHTLSISPDCALKDHSYARHRIADQSQFHYYAPTLGSQPRSLPSPANGYSQGQVSHLTVAPEAPGSAYPHDYAPSWSAPTGMTQPHAQTSTPVAPPTASSRLTLPPISFPDGDGDRTPRFTSTTDPSAYAYRRGDNNPGNNHYRQR
ncbi:hypothetical protein I302_105622 [Kwoniella bestiolae CBS 10118]|uniref:Uncharacterized protein n=1 Tax=Kwoniella bestiolae CBS 10118 TaxID=1296100 RepID=A0AAJ8K9P1_9TREE